MRIGGAGAGFGSSAAQPVSAMKAASAAARRLFDTMHPLLKRPRQDEQEYAKTNRDPGDRRERREIGVEADLKVSHLPSDRLDTRELGDDSGEILGDRDRQE